MTPIRFLSMATSALSNNCECFSGKLKKSILFQLKALQGKTFFARHYLFTKLWTKHSEKGGYFA
jgi:hypothetical protein